MKETEKTDFFSSELGIELEEEIGNPPAGEEVVPYTYDQAVAEAQKISDVEQRQVLLDMLERNRTAALLKQLDNDEERENRQMFLQVVMENFVTKRMRANNIIEDLRYKVASDLLANSDFLDNETRVMLLDKLTTATQSDAARASAGSGGGDFMPSPTTQLVINNNNNSGDGTQNVVTPPSAFSQNIKVDQINHLNEALRMWSTTGAPVKATDAEFYPQDEKPADGDDSKDDESV